MSLLTICLLDGSFAMRFELVFLAISISIVSEESTIDPSDVINCQVTVGFHSPLILVAFSMASFSISPAILVKCEDENVSMFVPTVEKEGRAETWLQKKKYLVVVGEQHSFTSTFKGTSQNNYRWNYPSWARQADGNSESKGSGNSSTTSRICLEETPCERRFPEGYSI